MERGLRQGRARQLDRSLRTVAISLLLAACLFACPAAARPSGDSDSLFTAAEALGSRAFAHLQAQCAFGPRNPGSSGHAKCLEYIQTTLARAGGRITTQAFSHQAPGLSAPVALTNVVARFGPERSGGILLCAHWDTRPWADRDPDPARRGDPILGANDGGSGTGLLLALAERLAEEPPDFPVTLVFFDGEDLGREGHGEEYLAGSVHFAERLPELLPHLCLLLDMVASETMVLTLEATSRSLQPDWAGVIDGIAERWAISTYDPIWAPPVIDDHIPLLQAGLPALCLIDFRDPHWHTHADSPAHCSAASLRDTALVVLGLLEGPHLR